MHTFMISGYSSKNVGRAIEDALCKLSGLLEKGAVLAVFPPELGKSDSGVFIADLVACANMPSETGDERGHGCNLKKEIESIEHARLLSREKCAHDKTLYSHLSRARELSEGFLSHDSWVTLGKEEALYLQEHLQQDFTCAGGMETYAPHVPYPHKIWPELKDE